MNFWEVLGIEPTDKLSDIKKAYAKNLRLHHPEEDPEGFQKLTEAYAAASEYVKHGFYKDKENDTSAEEEETSELHNIDFSNHSEESSLDDNFKNYVDKFMLKVEELYNDFYSRIDIEKWQEVLNSSAIWYLGNKDYLYDRFLEFLTKHNYLPKAIWKLIDDTLGLTENKSYFYERYYEELIDPIYSCINTPFEFSFKHFRNIENVNIDGYFSFREQGYYAFMRGDLKEAEKQFRSAYYIYEDDPSLLKMISEYYFAIKDFNSALEYLHRTLSIEPEDEAATFLKAKVLYEKNDAKASLEICNELSSRYPEESEVMSLVGRCYFKLNDMENCEKVFSKIIKENPLDLQAKIILMRIAYKKKNELKGKHKKVELEKLCKEAEISQKLVNRRIAPYIKPLLCVFVFLVICTILSFTSMMKDAHISISKENAANFIKGKRTPVTINNYNELVKLKSGENAVKVNLKDVEILNLTKIEKKEGNKIVTSYVDDEKLIDDNIDEKGYCCVCIAKFDGKYIIVMEDVDHSPQYGEPVSINYVGTVYKNNSSQFTSGIYEALKDEDIKDKYEGKKINTAIYLGEEEKIEASNGFKSFVFVISIVFEIILLIFCVLKQIIFSLKGGKA